MKKLVSLVAIMVMTMPAFAAPSGARGRASMQSNMIMAAPRATASTNQINAMASQSSVRVEPTFATVTEEVVVEEPVKDMREKEKAACLNNNVGLGNTFVWASRFSNAASYHSMIEDVENPENNVCFVRVELRSSDSRINVNDIPEKYFVMGTPVECGSWVDEQMMRQRILDAKKSARVWSTVGATVGGAGIGVGAMELFGNKLIGGKVEGQVALTDTEALISQLLVAQDEDKTLYDATIQDLRDLKKACEKLGTDKPDECGTFDYDSVLTQFNAK